MSRYPETIVTYLGKNRGLLCHLGFIVFAIGILLAHRSPLSSVVLEGRVFLGLGLRLVAVFTEVSGI